MITMEPKDLNKTNDERSTLPRSHMFMSLASLLDRQSL